MWTLTCHSNMVSNIIIKLPNKSEELLVTANLRASNTSTSPKPVLIVDPLHSTMDNTRVPRQASYCVVLGCSQGIMCQARYAHILNKGTDSCLLSYSD